MPMRDARTGTQNADRRRHRTRPVGGSAYVIRSLSAVRSAAGRPPGERANPRANAGRHQAAPQLRQATVTPGQVPTGRHRATPSDARNVTGGQGVAGSNPADPTDDKTFSNIVTTHKSQQESQLVVQWLV